MSNNLDTELILKEIVSKLKERGRVVSLFKTTGGIIVEHIEDGVVLLEIHNYCGENLSAIKTADGVIEELEGFIGELFGADTSVDRGGIILSLQNGIKLFLTAKPLKTID